MLHFKKTNTRRRGTAVAATTAAIALALSACGGGGGGSSADDGPVELNFTWWGADARAQLTEEVIAEFEEQNPDITIKANWTAWDSYWDKLATSTAGGDAPDVMQMDESRIAAYGERESLLDLNTVGDTLDLSSMTPEVLNTGKVQDAIVGAPVGVGIFSVGVNPEILERAGLEMPDDTTWTWDDFVDMSAQVTEELGDEGITGFDFFGTQSSELGAFVRQHGEELFPREGETPVSAETLEKFFTFALELVDAGATPDASTQTQNVTAPLEQQPFGTNTTAFHLQFHTQIQAFVDASGSELVLLRLPAQAEGESSRMVNKASMYWSISSRTEHPEEAARFVDFLINDEDAAKILQVERGVPAIPAVQEAIRPDLGSTGAMALDFAAEMQEEVVEPPQVTPSNASEFGSELSLIGSEVLFGRQTPQQAAEATLAVLENLR